MSDEEAFFEVWFQLERQKSWERSRIPSDAKNPPEGWSMGLRGWMLEGWMARASLHVTQSAKAT